MKNILKLSFILLFIVSLWSCVQPIDNYKGGIIYIKDNRDTPSVVIKLKDKNDKYFFKKIYLIDFDFNRYNVGDTIK